MFNQGSEMTLKADMTPWYKMISIWLVATSTDGEGLNSDSKLLIEVLTSVRSKRSFMYEANGFNDGYETFAHMAGN